MKHLIAHVIAPVCAIAVFVPACGSDGNDAQLDRPGATAAPLPESARSTATSDPPPTSAVEANGEVVDMAALDNSFRPERVEVVAGTAIRWENRGRNDHDVVPADDSLAWGVEASGFAPGDEYTVMFETPGEYRYFCSIHGTKDVGMIGTVVVVAVDTGMS